MSRCLSRLIVQVNCPICSSSLVQYLEMEDRYHSNMVQTVMLICLLSVVIRPTRRYFTQMEMLTLQVIKLCSACTTFEKTEVLIVPHHL